MVVFVADPVFRYTADSTVPTIERNVEVEVADSGTLGRIDLNRNDVGVSGTALRVLDTFLDNSCTIDFLNSNDSALVRGGVSIMARRKQGRMELQPGDALVLPAHPKFHVLGVTSYSLSVKEGVVARVEPPSSATGGAVTITINTPSTDDGGESPRLVFQPEERSSDDDIYDKGGSTLPPPIRASPGRAGGLVERRGADGGRPGGGGARVRIQEADAAVQEGDGRERPGGAAAIGAQPPSG